MCIEKYQKLFKDEHFITARDNKEICLFIGAGVGYNIGMPSWDGLASGISDFCLKHKVFNHSFVHTLKQLTDPLKIITFCEKGIQKKQKEQLFDDYLKKLFLTVPNSKYCKSEIYKNLVKICQEKKALIVQTNYDNVIETESCKKSNCNLQAYIPFLETTGSINLENCLVYLHGKIEVKSPNSEFHYEDLVLTRKQYNDVYVLDNEKNNKFEKQKAFFNNLLKNYYIIFLGYSLQDVEIIQLIANKEESKKYKEIKVIIDECDVKKLVNQIDSEYLKIASNEEIQAYSYSTERLGFKAFETVVKQLKKELFKEQGPTFLPTNADEVNFDG